MGISNHLRSPAPGMACPPRGNAPPIAVTGPGRAPPGTGRCALSYSGLRSELNANPL
jgi:hypothetical protein